MVGAPHIEAVKAMLDVDTLEKLERTRAFIAQPDIATSEVLAAVFDHKFKQLCQPSNHQQRLSKRAKKP